MKQCLGAKISRESDVDDLKSFIISASGGRLSDVQVISVALYRAWIAMVMNLLDSIFEAAQRCYLPELLSASCFPTSRGRMTYIFVVNGMMLLCRPV